MAETKKTSSKKNNPKSEAKSTVAFKGSSKKASSNKSTKAPKTNSVKKETKEVKDVKNKETKRVIEVTSQVYKNEPIITKEIDKDKVEKRLETIKKEERKNNIIIGVLIVIMVALFIVGVIYIYDHTKDKDSNKNYAQYENKENIRYNKNNTSSNKDEEKDNNTNTDNKENNHQEEIKDYENIKSISIKDYEKKLNAKEKMIVLISKEGCGFCTLFEPTFNDTLKELDLVAYKIDISKIATNEEYELFNNLFKISGTPTTFIIENKEVKSKLVGNQSKETTLDWLKANY